MNYYYFLFYVLLYYCYYQFVLLIEYLSKFINIDLMESMEPIEPIEPMDDGLPEIECNKRLKIMKKDLSNSILKYIDLLCDELLQNEIISINEIQNIKYKIKNNQIDNNTIINYLENKKTLHKQISISGGDKFSKVTPNFGNILSGKWQVPMPRPPVCINNFSSFL